MKFGIAYSVLVCLSVLGSVKPDENLQFPDEAEHEQLCDPGTGKENGHCTPITSCPEALKSISNGKIPVLCSFKGKDPIVCCAKTEKPGPKVEPTNTQPNKTATSFQPGRKSMPYLRYPGCGLRTKGSSELNRSEADKKPSVAGGEPSVPFSWPWMVAIFSRVHSSRPRFHCGGSLISDQYILTAAHCFQTNRDPSKYYAVIQAHERNRGYVHGLSSIKVHENYTTKTYYNDIAILRLTLPVTLGDDILKTRPVCLPSPTLARRNMDGKQVVVTGWGDTEFGGADSNVLREAVVSVVPRLRCNATYSALSTFRFPNGIDSRMLCAGVADGSKDACMGDSGGPLVIMDGLWTQVGIVSFGYRCAEPGFPGVYTRVSEYLDWIEKNTNIPRVID